MEIMIHILLEALSVTSGLTCARALTQAYDYIAIEERKIHSSGDSLSTYSGLENRSGDTDSS